jgi:ariadne-1
MPLLLLLLLLLLPHTQCMICFEEYPRSSMRSAACKHGFCTDCWAGYLSNAVTSGPSVLDLRCPLPDCKAEVRMVQ